MDTYQKKTSSKDHINILIINLHSYFNSGDASLAETTLALLRESFPQSKIFFAVNDVESFKGEEIVLHSFTSIVQKIRRDNKPKWFLPALLWLPISSLITALIYRVSGGRKYFILTHEAQELLSAYMDADMILSAPGNYLYSSGRIGLPFLLLIFSMWIAVLTRKPLYLLPQSIGPLTRRWERKLLKRCLSHGRILMVREPISLALLEEMGLSGPKVKLIPDLAFAFHSSSTSEAQDWLRSHKVGFEKDPPHLGITAILLPNQQHTSETQIRYEAAIADAIEHFYNQYNGRAILFTQVGGSKYVSNDQIPTARIMSLAKERNIPSEFIGLAQSPDILKGSYGLMSMFLGTRLHSNLFAISEGVPTLALAYFHKTNGVMQMMGLGEWVLNAKDVDSGNLIQHIDALWKEREVVTQQIQNISSSLSLKASQTMRIIASDFYETDYAAT